MSFSSADESPLSAAEVAERRMMLDALEVKVILPHIGRSNALYAVGMDRDKATNEDICRRMGDLMQGHIQRHGIPMPATDEDSMVERAVGLYQLMKRHPDNLHATDSKLHLLGGIKLTAAMLLVGFDKSQIKGSSGPYQKCNRRKIKIAKQRQTAATTTPQTTGQPESLHNANTGDNASLISPLTCDADPFFGGSPTQTPIPPTAQTTASTVSIPELLEECYFYPPTFPIEVDDPSLYSSVLSENAVDPRMAMNQRHHLQAISQLTTTTSRRSTTEEAHHHRQLLEDIKAIRSSVFKAATITWKGVVEGHNTLKVFDSANKVAVSFNNLCRLELFSGNEVARAVERGDAGKSPPRRGRPLTLPQEEFDALANAVFTFSAIQQINSQDRHTRRELQSMVGEIVNSFREEKGYYPLGEVNLFRRVEMHNSRQQGLQNTDPREANRVAWLTHQTQKLNYERWEEALIELGFAQLPQARDPPGEYAVVIPGQARRILQLDEMALSLDANTRGGGRPSHVPTAVGIQESGSSNPKGGEKVTVIHGINFADEVLPPYIQFPTRAKDPENFKLKTQLLVSFRQVKGMYGFRHEKYHDVGFGMNQKGGMNKEGFRKYCIEFLCLLYPDAKDEPLRRVIIKADSGPGRLNVNLLSDLRALGFYMFPGVPNGTEVGQEMDQMYGLAKTRNYENRNKLYRARVRTEGEGAMLSLADIGYIIFGGTVLLTDGSSIELRPAFDDCFDAEHIRRAREKCGYVPCTRAALDDPKVRHEIVLNEDGTPDATADPLGALYEALENQNIEAVSFLINAGYRKANKLKIAIRRVTSNQTRGRTRVIMEPNTRARQNLIMEVATAGQWFQVTNGGGPMNSNDAIIAWARKDMLTKASGLRKTKAAINAFSILDSSAKEIIASNVTVEKMKRFDLKTLLSWKQGPFPKAPNDEKLASLSRPLMANLWLTKYKVLPMPQVEEMWTNEMEAELVKLESGEIEDIINDTALKRSFERDNEYLQTRLTSLSCRRRKQVVRGMLSDLSPNDREELLHYLTFCDYSRIEEDNDDDDDDNQYAGTELLQGYNGNMNDNSSNNGNHSMILSPQPPSRSMLLSPRNHSVVMSPQSTNSMLQTPQARGEQMSMSFLSDDDD